MRRGGSLVRSKARQPAKGAQQAVAALPWGRIVPLLALLVLPLLSLAAAPAAAQIPQAAGDEPALITADRMTYDEQLGIVTASGSVEISQGGRALVADSVSYNVNTDVVTASGNVALVETTGDIYFSDYMEVTGDLREGFVRDIRVLMTDNSRMAAASGVRTGGNRSELSKTVYSPCELCATDPTRAPLWQIKANKVVWDEEEQVIFYRDATVEFFGVPVFYTPYFEHPDPTVDRKTGFLTPTFGNSQQLGTIIETPYFIVLDDTSDVTISPIFTTKQGVVGQGEVRKLFENGYAEVGGSATFADFVEENGEVVDQRFRGFIEAHGRYDIDDNFRAAVDIARTSDDTYLRVYNLGSESTLTTQALLEGFDGRDYGSLRAITWQGLRDDDDPGTMPIILPLAEYSHISEPDQWGGVYRFDASVLSLFRTEGRDTRRLSVGGSWTLPYTAPSGEVYTLTAALRADGYWTDDFDPDDPSNLDPGSSFGNEFAGRIVPEVALNWRYPLVRQTGSMQQIIEPIAQIRLAPPNVNPDGIPNEDSLGLEFDDTNLFSLSRFPGLDVVDPGPRIDYGLKWTGLGAGGGYTSVFVGQSYRPLADNDDVYPLGSGLENHVSDIIGHIEASPAEWLNASYRFQVDAQSYSFSRHELSLNAGIPELNLEIDYLYSDELLTSFTSDELLQNRNELYVRLNSQFAENWSGFVSHRQDFEEGIALTTRVGLKYQDECFTIEGIYERTNFRDREVEPDNAIMIRIALRNLGEIAVE